MAISPSLQVPDKDIVLTKDDVKDITQVELEALLLSKLGSEDSGYVWWWKVVKFAKGEQLVVRDEKAVGNGMVQEAKAWFKSSVKSRASHVVVVTRSFMTFDREE
ncbi:hypothetical protein LTR85_011677 [Meristemomyces frigidus]|nr:hypothetical protein LTR85_011677 [Meristemomyces frigidus]